MHGAHKTKIIPLLIIVAVALAYSNTLNAPFIFDDFSVTHNPHFHGPFSLQKALFAPQPSTLAGRPVASLSFAINFAFGQMNPWGYHIVNIALHIFSALLLYGILRRMLQWLHSAPRACDGPAAMASLVWALHPLLTESVTYIIQRTELLMGMFLLLTIYCVVRGQDSPRSRYWYMAAVVSCALGMGSKETMVVAPILILIFDRIFLSDSWSEIIHKRWGLYGGLTATWLLLGALVVGNPHGESAGFHFEDLTPWDYARTQLGVIVHYLRLSIWPHPLVLDYNDWPIARAFQDVWLSAVMVFGLLLATAWALWKKSAFGFGGAWFFLLLAPTSSFLPLYGEVVAERRMYLPLIAVVATILVGTERLIQKFSTAKRTSWLKTGAAFFLIVAFGIATFHRNSNYRSAISIWQDTVSKRPQNVRAHSNLGLVLKEAGDYEAAIRQFREVLRLKPDTAEAYHNIAVTLALDGKPQEAIEHYRRAIEIDPNLAAAHHNLGIQLGNEGLTDEGIEHLRIAARLKPDFAATHDELAKLLMRRGELENAAAHFLRAIQLNPYSFEAFFNLGVVRTRQAQYEKAAECFSQAIRLRPEFPALYYNLGVVVAALGRPAEAANHFRSAIRLAPQYVEAHFNLAVILQSQNHNEESLNHFQTAEAIYAESENWANAAEAATQALALAGKLGRAKLIEEIKTRLQAYQLKTAPP